MPCTKKLAVFLGLRKRTDPLSNFDNQYARERILQTLRRNPVIDDDLAIAQSIYDVGELVGFDHGHNIISEGEQDTDVYFLLSGEVDIVFTGRKRTMRSAPNQIGEMAAIEPGKPRSASARVRSDTASAWKVSGPNFHSIWAKNGRLKERLQVEMSARHRERIAAETVFNENSNIPWLLVSLMAGLVASITVWFVVSLQGWTQSAQTIAIGGTGISSFFVVLLTNPAFFWRRCFAVALGCLIGHTIIDNGFVIDANQGFGNLQVMFSPSAASEDWLNSLMKSLPFLLILGISALKDKR